MSETKKGQCRWKLVVAGIPRSTWKTARGARGAYRRYMQANPDGKAWIRAEHHTGERWELTEHVKPETHI